MIRMMNKVKENGLFVALTVSMLMGMTLVLTLLSLMADNMTRIF